jgi:hypothetical protein
MFPYFQILIFGHKTNFGSEKKYTYFFKKEHQKFLDEFGVCTYSKYDSQNCFHYKGKLSNFDMGFLFTIWEFKNLNNIDVSKIDIQNKFDLFNYRIDNAEIFNPDSELRQDIKFDYTFKNGINININDTDTINYIFKGDSYFGCYGNFHAISLGNIIDKNQVVFHNDFEKPLTAIILYKKNKRFFVITVESDRYFEPNIINVLNIGNGKIFKLLNYSKKEYKYNENYTSNTLQDSTLINNNH